jgi:hypothetical protein
MTKIRYHEPVPEGCDIASSATKLFLEQLKERSTTKCKNIFSIANWNAQHVMCDELICDKLWKAGVLGLTTVSNCMQFK